MESIIWLIYYRSLDFSTLVHTTNLHGLPMIHRQIKNLHMFGRLMQYEKNLWMRQIIFSFFFRSKCISYISDSSRSSMNDYLQAAHNYIMYTMFLLTYVQLENDCLNKWHEILGRRLAYSLQAYNTAWTINFKNC